MDLIIIIVFVKFDIVFLLFVDVVFLFKVLINKYLVDEVLIVILFVMVNVKIFDLYLLFFMFIIWINFNINVRNDIWIFIL